MHQNARRVIFAVFAAIFFVGAPLIVFYTAGYRLNFTTWRVQQTGVIALSSTPKGASVSINGTVLNTKTPYVIQRLSPGKYTVTLKRDGYKTWTQEMNVESGATTYATATLFAEVEPELILAQSAIAVSSEPSGRFIDLLVTNEDHTQSILRYDTVTNLSRTLVSLTETYTAMKRDRKESTLILSNATETIGISLSSGVIITATELSDVQDQLPGYEFFDNGSQTEFRKTDDHSLIALLPPSTYTVTFSNETFTVFSDIRQRSYIFRPASNTVTQMNISAQRVAANATEPVLATSDGNEIDLYNTNTGEVTLITRQSEPILALGWHNDQRTLLCATATSIFAVDQENYTTRDVTTLIQNASIVDMWLDTTGKRLTFYGTMNNQTGIWSLALTQ